MGKYNMHRDAIGKGENGRYTEEFRATIVEYIKKGMSCIETCNELGVDKLNMSFRQLYYRLAREETDGVVLPKITSKGITEGELVRRGAVPLKAPSKFIAKSKAVVINPVERKYKWAVTEPQIGNTKGVVTKPQKPSEVVTEPKKLSGVVTEPQKPSEADPKLEKMTNKDLEVLSLVDTLISSYCGKGHLSFLKDSIVAKIIELELEIVSKRKNLDYLKTLLKSLED